MQCNDFSYVPSILFVQNAVIHYSVLKLALITEIITVPNGTNEETKPPSKIWDKKTLFYVMSRRPPRRKTSSCHLCLVVVVHLWLLLALLLVFFHFCLLQGLHVHLICLHLIAATCGSDAAAAALQQTKIQQQQKLFFVVVVVVFVGTQTSLWSELLPYNAALYGTGPMCFHGRLSHEGRFFICRWRPAYRSVTQGRAPAVAVRHRLANRVPIRLVQSLLGFVVSMSHEITCCYQLS